MSTAFNESVKRVYLNGNLIAIELADGTHKIYKHQKDDGYYEKKTESIIEIGRLFEPPPTQREKTITSLIKNIPNVEKQTLAEMLKIAKTSNATPDQIIMEINEALGGEQNE